MSNARNRQTAPRSLQAYLTSPASRRKNAQDVPTIAKQQKAPVPLIGRAIDDPDPEEDDFDQTNSVQDSGLASQSVQSSSVGATPVFTPKQVHMPFQPAADWSDSDDDMPAIKEGEENEEAEEADKHTNEIELDSSVSKKVAPVLDNPEVQVSITERQPPSLTRSESQSSESRRLRFQPGTPIDDRKAEAERNLLFTGNAEIKTDYNSQEESSQEKTNDDQSQDNSQEDDDEIFGRSSYADNYFEKMMLGPPKGETNNKQKSPDLKAKFDKQQAGGVQSGVQSGAQGGVQGSVPFGIHNTVKSNPMFNDPISIEPIGPVSTEPVLSKNIIDQSFEDTEISGKSAMDIIAAQVDQEIVDKAVIPINSEVEIHPAEPKQPDIEKETTFNMTSKINTTSSVEKESAAEEQMMNFFNMKSKIKKETVEELKTVETLEKIETAETVQTSGSVETVKAVETTKTVETTQPTIEIGPSKNLTPESSVQETEILESAAPETATPETATPETATPETSYFNMKSLVSKVSDLAFGAQTVPDPEKVPEIKTEPEESTAVKNLVQNLNKAESESKPVEQKTEEPFDSTKYLMSAMFGAKKKATPEPERKVINRKAVIPGMTKPELLTEDDTPQRKLSSEQETLSRLESSELSPPDTDLQKNKTTTDKIEIQNESEEESQSSSSEDENQTDEQRLDKMLDRRRKERATEKMPQTPKPDARSAAGLQDRLSNLSELHEEETWVEQEFVDLAKQARQERERRQKQELEEQTRLKESPGRISAIERARKDSMRLKSSDSVDGNGKPKGILKAVSAIGTEGLEGSSFGTPKVESKKKGIHFAEGTKKSRDAAGETESEDDSDDSKTEGETTDGETEGETTDGETDATESEEETNSEEEREDERERTELEDDIFSSRMITSKQLVSKPGIPLHPESDARVVFKFRDPDPHAVNALRREFKDCPEVQISCGDLFEDAPTCDAMVVPMTNAFGFLDQPPELEYQQRFNNVLQERVRAAIVAEEDGELLVGDAMILLAGDGSKAKDTIKQGCNGGKPVKYIIAVPIMRVPMFIMDTVNAYSAFRAIIRTVRRHNMLAGNKLPTIGSIQLPALCHGGFARMPPARIAAQLKMAYEVWVLEKHPSLNLAQDLGELASMHVRLSTFKAGHSV